MAKKHKTKEVNILRLGQKYRWGIILAVVILFISFNIFGTRSFIIGSLSKLRPTPTPTPSQNINISPAFGLSSDQANYTKLAIDELTRKLNVKKESIKVVRVKETTWNDSSLGCPEKNRLYIQTITQGFIVELSLGSKTYIYNGGLNKVVSCELK